MLLPLKLAMRIVPDGMHATFMSLAANHLMRGQALDERLYPLEGKRLALCVADTGNRFCFRIAAGRLRADSAIMQPDATITATLADLVRLALRAEDPDALFFARRLSIEGETETALYVKNLIDALDFDWDGHLRAVLGPGLSRGVQEGLRRTGLEGLIADSAGRIRTLVLRRSEESGKRSFQGAATQRMPDSPYQ